MHLGIKDGEATVSGFQGTVCDVNGSILRAGYAEAGYGLLEVGDDVGFPEALAKEVAETFDRMDVVRALVVAGGPPKSHCSRIVLLFDPVLEVGDDFFDEWRQFQGGQFGLHGVRIPADGSDGVSCREGGRGFRGKEGREHSVFFLPVLRFFGSIEEYLERLVFIFFLCLENKGLLPILIQSDRCGGERVDFSSPGAVGEGGDVVWFDFFFEMDVHFSPVLLRGSVSQIFCLQYAFCPL